MRDADVIVSLGCRFSEFTTKRWTLVPTAAQLVQVDIDPDELDRVHPPRVGLVSNATAAARALTAALGERVPASTGPARARLDRREMLRNEYVDVAAHPPASDPGGAVSSTALVRTGQVLADRDGIVVVQDVHCPVTWRRTSAGRSWAAARSFGSGCVRRS